jgi:hypothetical protein
LTKFGFIGKKCCICTEVAFLVRLTNCVELRSTREGTGCAATHEPLDFLWNLTVHYHIHKTFYTPYLIVVFAVARTYHCNIKVFYADVRIMMIIRT